MADAVNMAVVVTRYADISTDPAAGLEGEVTPLEVFTASKPVHIVCIMSEADALMPRPGRATLWRHGR
jgi:hypothetical protein